MPSEQRPSAPAGTEPPFTVVAADAVVSGAADAGTLPPADRVRALAARGRPVLVRCDRPGADDMPGAAASAAVYAWAGARFFATVHEREVGQALDMVAAVLGLRPPAVARRGLA